MRLISVALFLVLAALWMCLPIQSSEEMLIVEQDYKIFEPNNRDGGPTVKDTRQILYITRDALCIDEFGDGAGKMPTETYIIDLKNQRIVNLDNSAKTVLLDETFAERRARIVKRKKDVTNQLADAEPRPRQRLEKMFGFMLDDKRNYVQADAGTSKIGDVDCKKVKISDGNDAAFAPVEAAVHPTLEMPYDNSEVLYLLRIVSERMAAFLKENKKTFAHVPMEMHLQTPDGGKLDTKVVSVKALKLEQFDPKSRLLGDPFKIPEGYKVATRPGLKSVSPVTPDKPKEKAD